MLFNSFDLGVRSLTRLHLRKAVILAVMSAAVLTITQHPIAWAIEPDISGDITLNFTRILDNQGNTTGYSYGGAIANLKINLNLPITLDTSIASYMLNQPEVYWNNDLAWDNGLGIVLINAVIITKAVAGDGAGEPSLSDNINAINVLNNLGPTEKTISVSPLKITSPDIPGFEADFGAGATFQFNVTIPSPANVVLNQNTTLNSLSVQPGAQLHFQPEYSMVLRTGNSQNAGTITGANLTIQSGASLNNQGSLEWVGGAVYGSGGLTNQGNLTISGSGAKTIGYCTDGFWGTVAPGVVTNGGTITHASNSLLGISHGSTLNNLAGAVYDVQGDGTIISGFWVPDWPLNDYTSGGTINNAGLFRKSAGTGTAVVQDTYFNNTGTVEVDSGTLALSQGTSTSAHYEFTNGGQVNASLTWLGTNTANGNGVLAVGGKVAAGTTVAFGSSQFTNGAGLAINGLNVESGATLTLNMTGSQQAKVVGGLGGAGTTINTGNVTWSGGNIGDDVGTVFNQGNLVWTGGNVVGNSGLTNEGSLTITGNGGQAIGAVYKDSSWYIHFLPGVLTNAGTITHAADGVLAMGSGTTLNNLAGAVYDWQGDGQFGGIPYYDSPFYYQNSGGTINNAGLFRKSAGTGTSSIPSASFNNTGTVEVDSGTLTLQGGLTQSVGNILTGGTWDVKANSTLITTGGNITTNQGNVILDGVGSTFTKITSLANNQGSFSVLDGRNFTTAGDLANSGTVTVGSGSDFKVSGALSGTGNLSVDGMLTAYSISQNTITIGAGGIVMIGPVPGGPLSAQYQISPVPEPATITLLMLVGVGLGLWRFWKKWIEV